MSHESPHASFHRPSPNAGLCLLPAITLCLFAVGIGGCGDDAGAGPGATDADTPDVGLADADGGTPGESADATGDARADGGEDRTDEVYALDHLWTIEISLDPGDWDVLRRQTRDLRDILSGDCLTAPFESPFTWFRGSVTIDGERFDDVDVRKKGFIGSLSDERPSLKIDLGEYVRGQDLLGVRHLTLNNARQDPSIVRQCVGYRVFAAAGIVAPRCSFAHVRVNGDDLGVYVNVEPVKRAFLERHFGDVVGNLYEGTLSDFDERLIDTFEPKFDWMGPSRADLQAVADALLVDDDALRGALDAVIDLDEFLTFWAAEVLLVHLDGYASNRNNFYVYAHPVDGRFVFFPWGVDAVLTENELRGSRAESVYQQGAIARRLYAHPIVRQMYFERLRELLDFVWDEAMILGDIDRMEAVILPALQDEDARERVGWEIARVRTIVRERRGLLEAALADRPPAVNEDPGYIGCLDEVGHVEAEFATTWESMHEPVETWFDEGHVLEATYQGDEWRFASIGVAAGTDEEGALHLRLFGVFAEDVFVVVTFPLRVDDLTGGEHALDGEIYFTDQSSAGDGQYHRIGFVDADVIFEAASAEPGAPIAGTLTGGITWFRDEDAGGE